MKPLSLALAVALCIGPAGAQNLPDLGDTSQVALTPVQERRLGESIMRQIRADPAYLDDAEVTDYLNDIGYRLVANSPDSGGNFEFFAIDDASVNAFALPGGFVGVHTGLIVTAQSESELASVLGHEIAHVTQRHIARMVAAQQRAGIASLAALAVAILAARSNAQVSQAAVAAAQAGAIQTQLNFSREHEREADRIGLQIVEKSGFDPHAMPTFLERLQRSSRLYEGGAPSYLRTHPLTFERVADVQNRTQNIAFKQVPDSLEFLLVRARLSAQKGAPADAVTNFTNLIAEKKYNNEAAVRYGLTVALMRRNSFKAAIEAIAPLDRLAGGNPMVLALGAELQVKSGNIERGLAAYRQALSAYPGRRALVYGYASALLDTGRPEKAVEFIDDRLEHALSDPRLYEMQARGYAAMGKQLPRHRAQAEAYLLRGDVRHAIEQLQIAKSSGDGDFYQKSSVEARLKELMALDAESRRRD
ncbi:MAG: M48 family metalloprotease [Burkholderiales bacterium]